MEVIEVPEDFDFRTLPSVPQTEEFTGGVTVVYSGENMDEIVFEN